MSNSIIKLNAIENKILLLIEELEEIRDKSKLENSHSKQDINSSISNLDFAISNLQIAQLNEV